MSWKGMDLVVRIVGDLKRYRADLREAGRETQQAMAQAKAATQGLTAAQRGLESQAGRLAQASERMGGSLAGVSASAGMFGKVLGGLGLSNLAMRAVQTADGVTVLQNQLKLATGSAQAAGQAYDRLYGVAQDSRVSFTALGGTFAQMSRATKDAGISAERLMTVTQAIGNAMTISGGDAGSMNAALFQLQQGMASGTLRGEELNSVMEQTPRLAQAIAAGLGVSIGQLREMGMAGELTAQQVIRALESQADVLRNEVAGATMTVGQAFTQLGNAMTRYIGDADEATGASGLLARTVSALAGELDLVNEKMAQTQAEGGSGLLQVMNGIGTAIGRFSFALASESVSQFNWVVDKLTGGIFGLNRQVDLMPLNLRPVAEQLQITTQRVGDAQQAYALLEARLAKAPDNIYIKSELGNLARYIASLREAQTEQRKLMGMGASSTPGPVGSVPSGDTALARAQRAEWDANEKTRRDYLAGARTDVQKFNDEMAKARKAFGGVVPPEVEASLRTKFIKPMRDAASASQDAQKAARESAEVEAFFRQTVIDKEAEWADEAAKADKKRADEAAKAARESAEVEAFFRQQEIEAQERWDKQQQDAEDKLRKESAEAWEKTWDQVAQSFTDALMEGGRSVKDYLAGLFRTLVLRPVLAPAGAAVASAVTPSVAGAGDGSGGLSDAVGMLGQVAGISGALGTGIAAGFANALAGTFAGSLTAAGSLIGTGTVAGVSAGVGMAIGTVAPYALAAYAVYKALTAETPGEQHTGGFYSTAGRSGFDAAAAVTGSSGGETRDLIDRANPEIERAVAKGADALVSSVTAMAASLGQDMALALDVGFAANTNGQARNKNAFGYFGVSLDGQMVRTSQNRDMGEDAGAAFEQLMKDAGAAMAELVLAGTDYARDGETALDTLTRLSTALQGVNQVFDTLGLRAYEVSLASGDMASSLADLFGGLQGLASASAAYYQAFYSEEERAATTRRQLGAALAALDLELPGTRDGFRALVEAQDLTTDAGRRTYATLMGLAPAFAELTSAMEQAGAGVEDEIARLRGLATAGTAQGYAQLQARFATTTAAARAGSASALEALPGISQALEEAAALHAGTAQELALVRQQIAASLQTTLGGLGLRVPALATGTNVVPRDMLALIHKDEAVVPAAYNPAVGGVDVGRELMADLLTQVGRLAVDPFAADAGSAGGLQARLVDSSLQVPALEAGADVAPRDMLVMAGEDRASVPRAYGPAGGADVASSNKALGLQLGALVAELQGLRDEVRSGVTHSAKMARILDLVTREGHALATVVEA